MSRFPRTPAKTPAGGSDRVAGRRNAMSTKTSAAALESFRHRLFPARRRAPRHPAGETTTPTFDHAARKPLRFTRPGRPGAFYREPLRKLFPTFVGRLLSGHGRASYPSRTKISVSIPRVHRGDACGDSFWQFCSSSFRWLSPSPPIPNPCPTKSPPPATRFVPLNPKSTASIPLS